jgi:hypothetical protein
MTYPASTKIKFGCRKTNMFGSKGYINVGVVFVVEGSFPRGVVIGTDEDIHGGGSEPLPVVAGADLRFTLVGANYNEPPRLQITGGWREPGSIEDGY